MADLALRENKALYQNLKGYEEPRTIYHELLTAPIHEAWEGCLESLKEMTTISNSLFYRRLKGYEHEIDKENSEVYRTMKGFKEFEENEKPEEYTPCTDEEFDVFFAKFKREAGL